MAQSVVSRPPLCDVHALLVAWDGIIVHFSGVPAGAGGGFDVKFPDDLLRVLNGRAQDGIACSVVRPGDRFGDASGRRRNAWGCIGVIVRGRGEQSLVGVDPHDCGSWVTPAGRTCLQADKNLSLEEVWASLEHRRADDCNEWVLRDYDVVGVLVQPPYEVREFGQHASRRQLQFAFARWPMYTLLGYAMYEVTRNFELGKRVEVSELYPPAL